MFYTLHRMVKVAAWLLVLGVFLFAWSQRAALEPLLVWYEVYDNGGLEHNQALARVEGRAVHVIDGHTLQVRAPDNVYYTVRLAGFEPPVPPFSALESSREQRRRQALANLALNRWIHVEVSYSQDYNLLGVVHAGDRNLNIYFITNGLSALNRDYIKRLPRDLQYELFAAERARQKGLEAAQVAAR